MYIYIYVHWYNISGCSTVAIIRKQTGICQLNIFLIDKMFMFKPNNFQLFYFAGIIIETKASFSHCK